MINLKSFSKLILNKILNKFGHEIIHSNYLSQLKKNTIIEEINSEQKELLNSALKYTGVGIIPTWMGNAQGWVLSSKRIFRNKIKAARLIKERTDLLCANNKIWRLQTAVKADFKIGIRFAEFLGFNKEGLMVGYGPDKTDYYLMARIYK